MSGARDPLFRTLVGTLGVGTTLLGTFVIFFLSAVAPAAGTWFFLHQQLPAEPSAPAEDRGQQFSERGPALSGAPVLVRRETEQIKTAPDTQPHAAMRQQVETLARIWGGAVLVLIGLGGTCVYLLWKHVVVPLKRLKREAISVAGGKPGSHLTVPDEEDEIGMLARALRHLKAQVEASDGAGHTATPKASAAPSAPERGCLDDARPVEASDSVSVTYDRSREDAEGGSEASAGWTVSTEDVRPLSVHAARERDGATRGRSSLSVEDGTDESETGVRYDEFMAVIHPEDRAQLRRRQDQALRNGVPIDIEYRIVSPNGDDQALRERGVVKMGNDGSPTQFSGHVLDVTEEKANEQKIERLQNDYDHLLSSLPDALVVVEADSSTIVEANEAAASLFEAPVDELLGRQKTAFYPAGTKDQFAALFEAARHSGSSVPNAVRRFPDGTPIRVVTDADNEVPVSLALTSVERSGQTFFVAVLSDITDRKRVERTSAEERDRFVTLFESLPTPVLHCELTPEGTLVTDVNKAFEDVFGVNAKAAEGKDVNDLIVPGDKEAEAEQIERRVISGDTEHFEVQRQTTDGVRDFRLQATGRTSESDAAELYAIYTDITERKEREARLRGRRQKIESLYTVVSRLLAAEHHESVFRRVHTVLRDVLDYPFTTTGVVEEDRIVFEHTTAEAESSMPTPPPAPITSDRVSARALREEETVVSDRDAAPDWAPRGGSLEAVASLSVGEHGVITVGQTDGTAFTSFNLRLMGLLGTYAAVVLDRLEREQELRAAKEEAEDASEFKSAMLANISHEIRTPLTAINGFSEVLTEELEPPHENLAERVHKGGKRLLDTLDSVLQLSQLEAGTQELDPGRCGLDRIVRGTLDEWSAQAAEQSISLNVHIPNSPVEGLWDAELVGEIVGNLLDNAIKFTPSGGEVSVRVRNNDGHAVFEVEDTGVGIEEEFREDMFRAFKQESEGLRREFEGVGLGLAVTKKAVNRMGGSIEVDSEKGEGSRFLVRLPTEQ